MTYLQDRLNDYLSSKFWSYRNADLDNISRRYHLEINALFGTFLLGIQRLENQGKIPLAHQAMIEDMLTSCWTALDSSKIEWDSYQQSLLWGVQEDDPRYDPCY